MEPKEEDDLLRLAIAGDGAAFAALLQTYEPRLLGYASRRLPIAVQDLCSPEDIVQDTCYEACRLIRAFVPGAPGAFYHWLVRIANLRMKSTIRKYRSRRTRIASADVSEDSSVLSAINQLATYRRTPSASAAAHEFVSAVERSLERLVGAYRDVITHRFINGLSVEETAERMNKSSEQIYVLSSRALGALREQLRSASRFA